MADILIYHKPTCSTCRQVIKLVEESGQPFTTINYYEKTFSKSALKGLLKKAGLKSSEILRKKEEIYKKLTSVSGKSAASWDELSTKLSRCFHKSNAWENEFPGIPFEYSRFTWRVAALSGDSVDWDDFDDETDFHKLTFEYTGNDMRWLLFDKAAYEQRILLENKIPTSWMTS